MSTQTAQETDHHNAEVPNIMHLTMGIDILKTDPLAIAATSLPSIFQLSADKEVPGTSWYAPAASTITAIDSSSSATKTCLMKTAYDYQHQAQQHVSMSVGIPDVFSFSESESFSQFNQNKGERSSFTSYTHQVRESYKAEFNHKSADAKFNDEFAKDLQNLPIEYKKNFYRTFIKKWGTHFASKILMGGRCYIYKEMSFDQYSSLVKRGMSIDAGASGTYEDISAGASGGTSTEDSKYFKSTLEINNTDLRCIGGNPTLRPFSNWSNTVDDKPAPIEMHLLPINWALDCPQAANYWNAYNKSMVSDNLNLATQDYLKDCGIPYTQLENVVPIFQYTDIERNIMRYGTRDAGEVMNQNRPAGTFKIDTMAFLAFDTTSRGTVSLDESHNSSSGNYYIGNWNSGKWSQTRSDIFSVPKDVAAYTAPIYQFNGPAPHDPPYYATSEKDVPTGWTKGNEVFNCVSSQVHRLTE